MENNTYQEYKQECILFFKREIERFIIIDNNHQNQKNGFFYDNSFEDNDEDSNENYDYDDMEEFNEMMEAKEIFFDDLKHYAIDGPFLSNNYYELLKDDEDYILNLVKIWPHHSVEYNIFYHIASPRLIQSKNFITELLKLSPNSVKWNWGEFPNSYWEDEVFVIESLKKYLNPIQNVLLKFAPDFLKSNRKIILEAVQSNGYAFVFASEN